MTVPASGHGTASGGYPGVRSGVPRGAEPDQFPPFR
jgi:hypothetical protein